MDVNTFYRQMASCAQWKQSLSQQLLQCQQWFAEHHSDSTAARQCLQRAIKRLADDHFTLICVGNFSRGKTELINALLFTEYNQCLLPSKTGRTTACPTEIFFDTGAPPGCVRLLPIETRRTSTSLSKFKDIPNHWINLNFNSRDPLSIRRAMSQIAQVKQVLPSEARALGFDPQQLPQVDVDKTLRVEIPAWRHALVNLDHPLLRSGLRILDTPGLDALSNEPELTLTSLQQADVLMFLLAADTGATDSDQTLWREHLQAGVGSPNNKSEVSNNMATGHRGHVVTLLNKIDTLWNDVDSVANTELNIHALRETTARQLAQPIEHVIGVSAKQALQARAAGDSNLLRRSNLPQLEAQLAQLLLYKQQQLASHRVIADAINIMKSTRRQLKEQLYRSDQELEKLQRPQAATDDEQVNDPEHCRRLLQTLSLDIRQQHQQYHRQALDLRGYQQRLEKHHRALQAPLASLQLESLINSTHQQMINSWSPLGLSQAVEQFFQQLQEGVEQLGQAANAANNALLEIYQQAQHHSCSRVDAHKHCFDLQPHRQRLQQLEQQSQRFCRALGKTLNLKQRLTTRFIHSLIEAVRRVGQVLHQDVSRWLDEALAPISHQTQYQKALLEQQLLQLTNLNQQLEREQKYEQAHLQSFRTLIAQRETALFELDQILGGMPIGTPAHSSGRRVKLAGTGAQP